MKRILIVGIVFPVMMGCVDAVRSKADMSQESSVGEKTVENRSRSSSATLTFLDTLNRGKEMSLSEKDVSSLAVSEKSVQITKADDVAASRFRIQVLASSQIETVRQEKKSAETRTSLPVFMTLEQPFYKLYVGDFSTRAEAESQLPEIKKKGYSDAWIVRTRIFSE